MLSRKSSRGAGPCQRSQSSHSGTAVFLPVPIDARFDRYHAFASRISPIAFVSFK